MKFFINIANIVNHPVFWLDINEVSGSKANKPLSKPGSLSNPLFSMVAATLAHLHNSCNWLVYPSVYPVHNSRTQAYTKPAVHKNGHQILLWCRHSISNEIQVMYNALYLIHFTVAEAKLNIPGSESSLSAVQSNLSAQWVRCPVPHNESTFPRKESGSNQNLFCKIGPRSQLTPSFFSWIILLPPCSR